MKSAITFCILVCALLSQSILLKAANPAARTLVPPVGGGSSSVSWSGGPYTAVTADPALCTPLTCDEFLLTVNVPAAYYAANPGNSVRVRITWQSTPTDFDMYIYDAAGAMVNSSAQGSTTFEEADLGQLTSGTFRVQIVAFATVNAVYAGIATLGPPPQDNVRAARYKKGNFTFTQPKQLTGPDGVVFGVQDIEPRAAFDALGNIYVAAIDGIPAGTDVWKSVDGGSSFTYLGQPDGGQAASALAGRLPGAGGGDEDIAITASGRVCVVSLWLGSITSCSSSNGGALWVANPLSSDLPADDRQWIATYGDNVLYLTFAQLGALQSGTNSIVVLKSFDGGITFPQIAQATTPELGVQPDIQGNIAVDQRNGYVYTVFVAHPGNAVYIARSSDGGLSFVLAPVHTGPNGAAYTNVFPIIAVDRGGNVHAVFSDGKNVYLSSSSNQGAAWTTPVRVNNGGDTKTAIAPWVDAGDAGKVDIIWWGTPSPSNLAADADWKVFFAQTQNAFANNPAIAQSAATGVFHSGPICVNGTGCEDGTRNLAEYASTTIYRDGTGMIVYPDDKQTSNPLTWFVRQNGGSGTGSVPSAAARASVQSPEEKPADLPEKFELEQNFPNPFNPTTEFRYSIPVDSDVRLSVYSLLGQNVADLVDHRERAGIHTVRYDASQLPSGMYFYKLEAGSFSQVRKMVLMK